eukprot:7672725-Pyramimonas_sp.AAC.1
MAVVALGGRGSGARWTRASRRSPHQSWPTCPLRKHRLETDLASLGYCKETSGGWSRRRGLTPRGF